MADQEPPKAPFITSTYNHRLVLSILSGLAFLCLFYITYRAMPPRQNPLYDTEKRGSADAPLPNSQSSPTPAPSIQPFVSPPSTAAAHSQPLLAQTRLLTQTRLLPQTPPLAQTPLLPQTQRIHRPPPLWLASPRGQPNPSTGAARSTLDAATTLPRSPPPPYGRLSPSPPPPPYESPPTYSGGSHVIDHEILLYGAQFSVVPLLSRAPTFMSSSSDSSV